MISVGNHHVVPTNCDILYRVQNVSLDPLSHGREMVIRLRHVVVWGKHPFIEKRMDGVYMGKYKVYPIRCTLNMKYKYYNNPCRQM